MIFNCLKSNSGDKESNSPKLQRACLKTIWKSRFKNILQFQNGCSAGEGKAKVCSREVSGKGKCVKNSNALVTGGSILQPPTKFDFDTFVRHIAFGRKEYPVTIGGYLIVKEVGPSPVQSVREYLAVCMEEKNFYILKVLTVQENPKEDSDMLQMLGRYVLSTENAMLSILKGLDGVAQKHDWFNETFREDVDELCKDPSPKWVHRKILAVDCYLQHNFSPLCWDLINVFDYIVREIMLSEYEVLRLFCKMLKIVKQLHDLNVVHRDLKPKNFILNQRTGKLRLVNFYLSRHLASEKDLIRSKDGSPVFAPPELYSGKPYLGKPADLWSMGVSLYFMLFNIYPFVSIGDRVSQFLHKIKTGCFEIPKNHRFTPETMKLLNSLLDVDVNSRWTAAQALEEAGRIVEMLKPSPSKLSKLCRIFQTKCSCLGKNSKKDKKDKLQETAL